VKALEPKVVPIEAAKISAQDRAAVEAVEKARAQQRRAFLMNVGAMVSLVLLAAFAVWYVFIRSNERRLDQQIHIDGGDFISGTGVNSNVSEFWIDKYEVSIGQYAKFVEWIEANPGEEHNYDHEKQPKHLSHIPQYWQIYYQNAVANKAVHSVRQSLNSPAMVTFWDAWAYAKWKGRDLPTELEWERAARGKKGQAYTFGEEPDPKKANTGSDFDEHHPDVKGKIDGYNYWCDVDAMTQDKSPDGAIGMQGNVSEWTASWTPDKQFPILKGGNFRSPLQPLSEKIATVPPEKFEEWTGFRTISRTPPPKD
jgi:formylglycine-generating enzyme required for sulfatase activity